MRQSCPNVTFCLITQLHTKTAAAQRVCVYFFLCSCYSEGLHSSCGLEDETLRRSVCHYSITHTHTHSHTQWRFYYSAPLVVVCRTAGGHVSMRDPRISSCIHMDIPDLPYAHMYPLIVQYKPIFKPYAHI